ncbi:MAG: 1-acyl-sn-glycerol-3-phosphate acyltransferase [Solirubrobacteraceae bacterium]
MGHETLPREAQQNRHAASHASADQNGRSPAEQNGHASAGQSAPAVQDAPDAFHRRARQSGVNLFVYLIARAVLQPFFHLYFRMRRIGLEYVPRTGPVIVAANHRSFLDPFVIGTMARRPMYYMAKKELFAKRWQAWFLSALGAFPVDRGASDEESMKTAKAILDRGGIVLVFPEGTRIRPGGLGTPHRGVGRLALQTGAPVVPVAVIGTEDVRRGWRIRPRKIRIRAGRPLRFPVVAEPSPELARAVTDRIWPCVMLQWEWLGGLPPIRRAAIIGAGTWGTGLAVSLARAGMEVELGARSREQAEAMQSARVNETYLPGVDLPETVQVKRAVDLDLETADLVCLAVPARALPGVLAAHGEHIPSSAGLLVLSKGLVPPLGTLPSAFASERCAARGVAVLGGPAHAAEVVERGASVVVGCTDRALAKRLADVLRRAGLDVEITGDVTGVELAGTAKNVAALAAAAAASAGPNIAGAAAGKVFAEVDALARRRGARPETFAGLAGVGDLVATVTGQSSRNRRAGELLAQGVPAEDVVRALGQTAEAVDAIPLLAAVVRNEQLRAPAIEGLAAFVEGRIEPDSWTAMVTDPRWLAQRGTVRAA